MSRPTASHWETPENRVTIFDHRRVMLEFEPGELPDLYTNSGRTPIAPMSAELYYSIQENGRHPLISITVRGLPTDPADIARLAHKRWGSINRHVETDAIPAALARLVERHRPRYPQIPEPARTPGAHLRHPSDTSGL
jgi:hypothetical protein